jgi:hypothetical protein
MHVNFFEYFEPTRNNVLDQELSLSMSRQNLSGNWDSLYDSGKPSDPHIL